MKTIKIGVMPGKIEELAVEVGTTVEQAIEVAGLNASGYDIKVDGNTVTDLNASVDNAGIILLVKQVKGNSGMIKIGVMPGRIEEYAVEQGTTVAQAIEQAGLDTSGYDVKVDGSTVTDLNGTVDSAGIILLVKQVKGNSGTVKIGVMPGRISEYAFEEGTTISRALDEVGLDTSGYDVKVDGNTVTDFYQSIDSAGTILLVKQVKGNSGLVKIGVMPGRIEEYAIEQGTTIREAIEQAGLDTQGYDVKVDGNTITELDNVIQGAGIILLVKQVKGNSSITVKVGQMPGRIEEYAFESGTTIAQAIEQAGLDSSGYDVKIDGANVTDFNATVENSNIILLVKQVKGNK